MASRFTKAQGAPPDTAALRDDARPGFGESQNTPTSRMLLIVVPAVVAALGGVLDLSFAPRTYTGATSVLIEPAEAAAPGITVEDQARRIASDRVLRRTVIAEDLADDPEFAPRRSGLAPRLFRLLGLGRDSDTTTDRVAQATVSLASRLTVKRADDSPVFDLGVTSVDPAKAARLSDAVAVAFLAEGPNAQIPPARRDGGGAGGEFATAQTDLQSAEQRLEAFKHDRGMGDRTPDDRQAIADASARLSEASGHAAEIKARLDDIRQAKAGGSALDALSDSVASPLLDKLRAQYAELSRQQATLRQTLGDRHPAMIQSEQQLRDLRRSIASELGRIQAASETEFRAAQADVAALQARIKTLEGAATPSTADRRRLEELQRDVEARQAAYDRAFRDRAPDNADAVGAPATRIIASSTIPTTPLQPRALAVLAVALGLGIATGLVLLIAAELRGTLRRTKSVSRARSVAAPHDGSTSDLEPPVTEPATSVLGTVPSPFGNPATLVARGGLYDRLRTSWPTSLDAEHVPSLPAFRAAIHALMLDDLVPIHADGAPRAVLVTSLDGADSRTAFALGLAEAAAGQGQRAIVIDADEQGSILRELVTVASRPILIDLMGTSRICYRVTSPLRGSLSIVPIMPGESTIVRRLGTRGAAARIDGLAANFDLIIFDGPRTGEVNRLHALAATVDAVIIAAPKTTSQQAVDAAVAALHLPQGTHVSAVLLADLAEGAATSAAA